MKCGFFLLLSLNSSCRFFLGTYWNNVVPRGTASATKWAFVLASAAPTEEGWWGSAVHGWPAARGPRGLPAAWSGHGVALWPSETSVAVHRRVALSG